MNTLEMEMFADVLKTMEKHFLKKLVILFVLIVLKIKTEQTKGASYYLVNG